MYFPVFIRMALVLKPPKSQVALGFQRKSCINIAFLSRVFLIQCLIFCYFTALILYFFLPVALRPNAGHSLRILEAYRSHTTTQRTQYDSSRRVIGSSQRPLPDNTQHSQKTDRHPPGGIRTRSSSKLAATDPRLRSHGHWDQPFILY